VCGETELVSKRLRADLTRALLCRLPCVATTPPPRPAAALTHDADDAVF